MPELALALASYGKLIGPAAAGARGGLRQLHHVQGHDPGVKSMAASQHEALIRAYIDEVFNGHRLDTLENYWHDDLTSHWLAWRPSTGCLLGAWRWRASSPPFRTLPIP